MKTTRKNGKAKNDKALITKANKAIARYRKEYQSNRLHMDAVSGDVQAQAILSLANRLFVTDKSDRKLALETGLCTATLSRLRKGKTHEPRLRTFIKGAIAAGVDVSRIREPRRATKREAEALLTAPAAADKA